MKYRLFQYQFPAPPDLEDLNAFLATERVGSVEKHIVRSAEVSWLVFIVQVVGRSGKSGSDPRSEQKIDYREVFNDDDFRVFSELRTIRKRIATTEGIPLYNVFTNAQLANMVKLRPRTAPELARVEGVGQARIDSHGAELLAALEKLKGGDEEDRRTV
jgi:superfamily II DNA helicase RecQ